jgi:hypothetical protein
MQKIQIIRLFLALFGLAPAAGHVVEARAEKVPVEIVTLGDEPKRVTFGAPGNDVGLSHDAGMHKFSGAFEAPSTGRLLYRVTLFFEKNTLNIDVAMFRGRKPIDLTIKHKESPCWFKQVEKSEARGVDTWEWALEGMLIAQEQMQTCTDTELKNRAKVAWGKRGAQLADLSGGIFGVPNEQLAALLNIIPLGTATKAKIEKATLAAQKYYNRALGSEAVALYSAQEEAIDRHDFVTATSINETMRERIAENADLEKSYHDRGLDESSLEKQQNKIERESRDWASEKEKGPF